jgi:hypothetical protein
MELGQWRPTTVGELWVVLWISKFQKDLLLLARSSTLYGQATNRPSAGNENDRPEGGTKGEGRRHHCQKPVFVVSPILRHVAGRRVYYRCFSPPMLLIVIISFRKIIAASCRESTHAHG